MRDNAIEPAAEKLVYLWQQEGTDPYMPQVDEVIKKAGWAPLNNTTARVLCVVDDDRGLLVGFHVLQLFPHCEPLWVHPDYRGLKIADHLAERMLNFMLQIGARGFMVVADSPHAEELCKSHGMKLVTSPVYVY